MSIAVARVDSLTGIVAAKAAMSVPNPWRQNGSRVALGGFGEIDGRHLRQFLAATEWAKHEFDGRPPVAEVVWQRLSAGYVALARRVGDAAVGADL